ncbi:MAG: dUTP diphosphatase [Oscillospiraceae bacterium]|nr:dUTP diphosphatase [Oscillospiraceae bacterium]
MQVRIKKLDPNAVLPSYGTHSSAGADLYACCYAPVEIEAGQVVIIHTGLAVEIPEGYCGLVYARSSTASKKGLAPANKVGVIDADYRGELMVSILNHSAQTQTVMPGERIAQLVIAPFLKAEFELSDELSDTERGQGGFGSTGSM